MIVPRPLDKICQGTQKQCAELILKAIKTRLARQLESVVLTIGRTSFAGHSTTCPLSVNDSRVACAKCFNLAADAAEKSLATSFGQRPPRPQAHGELWPECIKSRLDAFRNAPLDDCCCWSESCL